VNAERLPSGLPVAGGLAGADAGQGGVRIEWGQLALVGLVDADGYLAA
jgi:hypothetical protein